MHRTAKNIACHAANILFRQDIRIFDAEIFHHRADAADVTEMPKQALILTADAVDSQVAYRVSAAVEDTLKCLRICRFADRRPALPGGIAGKVEVVHQLIVCGGIACVPRVYKLRELGEVGGCVNLKRIPACARAAEVWVAAVHDMPRHIHRRAEAGQLAFFVCPCRVIAKQRFKEACGSDVGGGQGCAVVMGSADAGARHAGIGIVVCERAAENTSGHASRIACAGDRGVQRGAVLHRAVGNTSRHAAGSAVVDGDTDLAG